MRIRICCDQESNLSALSVLYQNFCWKVQVTRKYRIQPSLPFMDEKLVDVKDVIVAAGLSYTVIDADPFYPTVIRKFISNILDAEERADGVDVYVTGSLV